MKFKPQKQSPRTTQAPTMSRCSPTTTSCLVMVATALFTSSLVLCQSYGSDPASAIASHYEPEMMAHHSSSSACVLTIKPANHSSSSYSTAMVNSYLSNYVTRREPYHHKGGSICITQHDVDAAIEEAKHSLGGYVPKEIYAANSEMPKPMHVIVVAEIITQATRILANRFKLPEPTILYDLPSIDFTKSHAIDKICPVFLKPSVNCEQTRYRTLTGFCNNLQYQSWGSTRSALVRFLAPDYYDSISLPRRAYDGSPLPSARVVSFVVHQDPHEYDKYHSMLSVVWGQFINHDLTLAVHATDENSNGPNDINCCKSDDAHPDCFPIEIPKGDPFYGYFNQKCMHFIRSAAGLQPGCSLGPVQALNKISAYLDGNIIYGGGIKTNQRLRTYHQGQLRTQPVSSASAYGSSAAASSNSYLAESYANAAGEHPAAAVASMGDAASEYLVAAGSQQHQLQRSLMMGEQMQTAASSYSGTGGYSQSKYKELLPPNKHNPDVGCERRGRAKDVYCFEAGDPRANEQIQLAATHTLLMREHNRVAKELSYINPYWDDERLFQEARQIVVAQLQHITFNEFLPLVIGKEKIYEYGLELEHPGRYYQGYDSKINAQVRVEFQAAAFRYGHSLVPSHIERYNKFHQKIESIRLSKLLKQPYDLYHPGVLDTYFLGLVNQRSGRMDPTMSTEVTNHLFEKPGKFFGHDLAAINIQRGRDMGVPGYNHFREYCGLPRAKYFEDLTGLISNKTLLRLSQLYKHVDDIDLFTAGISEYPIPDGVVGPTFACLIARQFVNSRRGDRYWYENAGYPAQFTIEQLDELRKSTAARLLCDNSDDIETIQASAMLVADPYSNPRVPCITLPSVDLTKWKEHYGPAAAPQSAPEQHQPSHMPEVAAHGHNTLAVNSEHYGPAPLNAHELSDEYQVNKQVESAAMAAAAAEAAGAYSSPNANGNGNGELVSDFEPLRTSTHHFVDHLVDVSNYRPEMTSYNSKAKAAAAA